MDLPCAAVYSGISGCCRLLSVVSLGEVCVQGDFEGMLSQSGLDAGGSSRCSCRPMFLGLEVGSKIPAAGGGSASGSAWPCDDLRVWHRFEGQRGVLCALLCSILLCSSC